MSERWTFTDDDLAAARLRAEQIQMIDLALGYTHRALRADPVAASFEGTLAEWAVQDSLGVPRNLDSSQPDPGYDVRSPRDYRVQVRSTPYSTGRLMFLAAHPLNADAATFAIVQCPTVWIVGGAWRKDFYLRCWRRDFGHGLTDYLGQHELEPWETFKERL